MRNADKPQADSECFASEDCTTVHARSDYSCVRNIFSYYHRAAKNYYSIQEINFGKNKMVARDFICQASEFDKLLGADPKKLKVDIDCLTLGGVL